MQCIRTRTRMCQRLEGTQAAQTTEEKPAGRADADDTAQAVKQLEQDPSGHGWVLTKHKYSQQELKQPEVSSSWRQLTDILFNSETAQRFQKAATRLLTHPTRWFLLLSAGQTGSLAPVSSLWMNSVGYYNLCCSTLKTQSHLQSTVEEQFSTCCFHWLL